METIEKVAAVCAAISSIAAAIAVLVKVVKWFAALKEKIDIIAEHESENYASILRLTIMSPDMPLSERLIAGDKYVSFGGNGEVKAKYNALRKQYEAREGQAS